MPVTFDTIEVGHDYTRPQLAKLWGYKSYEALSRGVVTPSDTPFIIQFITKKKQPFLPQYQDAFDDGVLEIDGENNHVSDERIINAASVGDEIHLFYRKQHHKPFIYYGKLHLTEYKRESDKPSRFKFVVDETEKGATEEIAKNMFGDSLYQQRARIALPILVRQAIAQQKLTYTDLAEELGISNPRILNYILGSVGTTLLELGHKWSETVPPIQYLVINKTTGLPGEGVDNSLAGHGTAQTMNRKQKEALVNAALGKVFSYPKWPQVLRTLGLKPVQPIVRKLIEKARGRWGGGESPDHRALKNYVSRHPESVGLKKSSGRGETEFLLPSGDSLDVLFRSTSCWTAVEVKSHISNEQDIIRGLFQCVKYRAVIDAWRGSEGESIEVRAILVLGATLPEMLVPLRNSLGIEVIENVRANG